MTEFTEVDNELENILNSIDNDALAVECQNEEPSTIPSCPQLFAQESLQEQDTEDTEEPEEEEEPIIVNWKEEAERYRAEADSLRVQLKKAKAAKKKTTVKVPKQRRTKQDEPFIPPNFPVPMYPRMYNDHSTGGMGYPLYYQDSIYMPPPMIPRGRHL